MGVWAEDRLLKCQSDSPMMLASSHATFRVAQTYTPISTGRFWHIATLLPSGAVLITGGIGGDMPLASAEIFK
jgi:hypothetical protein